LTDVLLQRLLQIILLTLVVYLGIGAYYGVVVGQTMRKAEASNPAIEIAATMIGREASEAYTIRRMGVPKWIVKAPTFWLALRMNE
jgi:hypothetical protein